MEFRTYEMQKKINNIEGKKSDPIDSKDLLKNDSVRPASTPVRDELSKYYEVEEQRKVDWGNEPIPEESDTGYGTNGRPVTNK